MQRITLVDHERKGQEEFRAFDPAAYCKKTFRMFAGEEEMVTLRFAEHYSGVVFDRFGKDIPLHRKADGQFTISVHVSAQGLTSYVFPPRFNRSFLSGVISTYWNAIMHPRSIAR